jgi:hypothetical protein
MIAFALRLLRLAWRFGLIRVLLRLLRAARRP